MVKNKFMEKTFVVSVVVLILSLSAFAWSNIYFQYNGVKQVEKQALVKINTINQSALSLIKDLKVLNNKEVNKVLKKYVK